MKVLIVSQYFWPESFRINDLSQGLVERGHEVTVLTGRPNYPEGSFFPGYGALRPMRETHGGATVLRVPLVPRGAGGKVRLSLNYLSFALSASLLGPFLCRGRYDLIFVYEPSPITVGLPAIVLKRLKKLPVIFWVQDLWPESLLATGAVSSERILGWVAKAVKYIYRRCDRILVTSRRFEPKVRNAGAEKSKIYYWPQWAEAHYRPMQLEDDAPERRELPEGFRVMFAGNIGAAQSFETILDAAAKLKDYPEIQWVVIGVGRVRRWVEQRVEQLGLEKKVHLMGVRPNEEMPRYLSLANSLMVTLRQEQIFSLTVPGKVQSYLACGRPIVASLDGEGAQVIHESGAGLVAPAQDADALAEAVLEMYRMPPEEREEMGRKGRVYFEEHFEREQLLDELEGWMHELVGERA